MAVHQGRILGIRQHHNPSKYAKQKVLIVEIDEYAYQVPFIEEENKVFLITVYPSRKATKFYLRKEAMEER